MRILVIAADYPPYHFGGYEIRLKNIIDQLVARGHIIQVLTSVKGKRTEMPELTVEYKVFRKLHNTAKAAFFPKEILFDFLDTGYLQGMINKFSPDLIYMGHINILSKALLPFLATLKLPIIYDEGGSGLIDAWTERGRWVRFNTDYVSRFAILNVIKPLAVKTISFLSQNRLKQRWVWPQNIRVVFNSELNCRNAQKKGVPVKESCVIHSGINLALFPFQPKQTLNNPLVIFVPARFEPRKGQLDAVHLLVKLRQAGIDAHMVFAGERWHDAYYQTYYDEMVQEIKYNHLEDRVTIHPMLHQVELVKLYHNADICLLPSYFKTGYSRVPLESMACGCVIVSYGNEGSNEIIQNHSNGILVNLGDTSAIVENIKHLVEHAEIAERIIFAARKEVEENCSMQKYIDRIESFILSADVGQKQH